MTWHDFQLNEAATDLKGAAAPAGNDVNQLACRQQRIMGNDLTISIATFAMQRTKHTVQPESS